MSKDIIPQNNVKSQYPNMSFRQQLMYVMEKSKEINKSSTGSISEDQITELADHIQDENFRTTPCPPQKQDIRNKLIEESQKVYKPIKKLAFLERKHAKPAYNEIMVCSCSPPQKITTGEFAGIYTVGCGKKCLNRVISTECCMSLCPANEYCANRRFQLQQYIQVYPIRTANRGWGLAAGQYIRKGQFVIEYLGEVFNIDSELGRARLEKYKTQPCTYLMSTSHNEVIDPARKGNMARFINHSCDPNCETQKWNVMGEICVGIFAKKNINEDEELTFDYRLDTHKTQLTKCLCGSKNCRQYLGLIPSNYSNAEQWLKKLKSLKCVNCKKASGNDDKSLILCDKCNRGWHIYCLKVPLKAIPSDSWLCDQCDFKGKNEETVKKKQKIQEVTVKLYLDKSHFEVLKSNLEDILELDVKLFWDKNMNDDGKFEVVIRGQKAKQAEKFVQELSKKNVISKQVVDEVVDIELKVEKIYLKNISNFCKMSDVQAILDYDKSVELDEIYSFNQVTSIYLTGRVSEIENLSTKIMDYTDTLAVFTIPLSNTESKVIEQQLGVFKAMIFPVDVRLSKEKTVVESPHPFFFYSREERKLVFIGTESEIKEVYKLWNAWISGQFAGETETFYHFILPVRATPAVKKVKNELTDPLKNSSGPLLKLFDPILPRKYLTVQITGSWKQILMLKSKILNEIKKESNDDLESFFYYVNAQMYRHIFKNAAKFVHAIEKFLTPQFFPNVDIRKVYILKFWDVYSSEILIEGTKNDPVDDFRNKVVSYFISDTDSLLNLLLLCDDERQVGFLMKKQFKLNYDEALKKILVFFGKFCKEYESKGKSEYNDYYLKAISQKLIDDFDNSFEMDFDKIAEKIIDDVRETKSIKNFSVFPISYSSDIDMNIWEPPNYSKLSGFLNNLTFMKILSGSDVNSFNQVLSNTTILSETKDKADLIIGSSKNFNNFLYVVFPDHDNK